MDSIISFLKLLNSFTLNLAGTYFLFTSRIVFSPSRVATKIKDSQQLEVAPSNYIIQAVIIIIGVWSFGYLATARMSKSQSWTFNLVIGIYFITIVYFFAFLLWCFRLGSKPMSFTIKCYNCVIGAFSPFCVILVEIARVFTFYSGRVYGTNNLENIIVLIFGVLAMVYLYKFMRIVQGVKFLKFFGTIIVYSIIVNKGIDKIFIVLIDILKAKNLI